MRILPILFLGVSLGAMAQTDAYIKMHDSHKRHPRAVAIEFPGNTEFPSDYDAIYGHGAVLENPWLAIRVYMDSRQSIDLYLKHKPGLELDRTGFYSTKEMVDNGDGCDVLWAGKSVAMGSFRGFKNGEPVIIDSVAVRGQRVIDDHTVMVYDKDWIYNGHPIQMTQTYTANPAKREINVEVKLDGYRPGDLFATGVQKIEKDNIGFILDKGVAASWGNNIPDKNHPEWIETVGLGIKVNPENIVSAKEDDLNYLFILRPDRDGKISYTITASGLREKEGFKTSASWFDYVRKLK